MIRQEHDGLTFGLKAPHVLSWLKAYGRVFCVFDQLISGNLCFGMEDGKERFFVKYAGAQTLMYAGQPEAAITRLRRAATLHQALRHPGLSHPLGAIEPGPGYALFFPWFDGFALAPMETHLQRLQTLTTTARLAMYDGLMDFIAFSEEKDHLAAGIANQHILVDFERSRAIFSSAGHFLPFPAHTPYPKLPGASAYLTPEAYKPGADLDERANVYMLGALAMTFFRQPATRNRPEWAAGAEHLRLASQALQEDRERRPRSAVEYRAAWRQAVLRMPGF